MKLKKIASLMLAGVMAVSMLTACGDANNIKDDDTTNNDTTVTAAPIVSALNSKLSKEQSDLLSFSSNTKLAAAVAEGAKKVSYTNIANAGEPTLLDFTTYKDIINAEKSVFDGVLPTVQMWNGKVAGDNHNYDQTWIFTYLVDGSIASVDSVANALVNGNNGLKDMFYEGSNLKTNGEFDFTYKGYAEMTQVKNDNTGDSCYLVAVMIEKTAVSADKVTITTGVSDVDKVVGQIKK